ncbi:MAG: hypothetical protein IAI50_04740 [Candidatus Eremiobacteraeota bacterium]|nr:hypothetical protein [Candidatus Eremiobacteraeota bacterium]
MGRKGDHMHDDYVTGDCELRVDFLGTTRIAYGPVRIDARLSQNALLIFGMLLLQRDERLDREQLAFTLWPDHAESDARANLRRQLYLLQHALPDAVREQLRCDARSITWAERESVRIDVADFERLGAEPGGVEAAASIYRGDFMPRVDHEWALDLRQRLASDFRCALERATRQCVGRGDWAAALRYLERLLGSDPWRENTLRDMMMLRYRLGDRAGALAVYQDFRRRVKAELDVDPMPETIRCHDAIVRGEPTRETIAFEPILQYA